MTTSRKICFSLALHFPLFLTFLGLSSLAVAEPRGEIRVVESWRPDINVLGHNVLEYLFEYALDRNELVPCLGLSRKWIGCGSFTGTVTDRNDDETCSYCRCLDHLPDQITCCAMDTRAFFRSTGP